jgi:hypothetical protein
MPKNLFTVYEREAKPTQRVIVSFPFDSNLSKNKALGTTRTGKWYTKAEHRKLKEDLYDLMKPECDKYAWKKEKYYLTIHVQKPSNRGDCVNYLDAIADVVKKCVQVDDNYMEVEQITFEVVREGVQKIYISVAQ